MKAGIFMVKFTILVIAVGVVARALTNVTLLGGAAAYWEMLLALVILVAAPVAIAVINTVEIITTRLRRTKNETKRLSDDFGPWHDDGCDVCSCRSYEHAPCADETDDTGTTAEEPGRGHGTRPAEDRGDP